jgi:plasmid stability protein
MTVSLNLPPQTESELRRRAAQEGKDVESFIREAVEARLAGSAIPAPRDPRPLTPAEWIRELREWAASHPTTTHFVDDSRESIYEGRGE